MAKFQEYVAEPSDKCFTCKHMGSDPDGAFCGTPESLKASANYGQGLTLARSKRGVCGPTATLYEKCQCTDRYCPHARPQHDRARRSDVHRELPERSSELGAQDVRRRAAAAPSTTFLKGHVSA